MEISEAKRNGMGKKMSKFDGFAIYLSKQTDTVLNLSFNEIEEIIGMKLCKSAYTYDAYWRTAGSHSLPNLILAYEYEVGSVDLVNHRVTLVRKI